MYSRIKLQQRMVFGYTIPTLLSLGVFFGVVYWSTHQVRTSFENVEVLQDKIFLFNQLTDYSKDLVRSSRGYLVSGNEKFFERYEERFEEFNAIAQEAKKSSLVVEDVERIDRIIQVTENYKKITDRMIALYKSGKKQEAIALFATGSGTELVEELDALTREFRDYQKKSLMLENDRSLATLGSLLLSMAIASLLLLAIAVLVAVVISSGITKTIRQETTAIASASSQIAATVAQQERTLAQQASSVNQTTSTMTELSASSSSTAEQCEASETSANQVLRLAESSVEGAETVLKLADRGTIAVQRTEEGISVLNETVEGISEQILRSMEQTSQISNITTLVSELANQTNMLALNAAVEAVRAGENGKGFSVIAAEIRKLADQSKNSAQKINTLVVNIEASINSTIRVTQDGKKRAEEVSQLSRETAEAFAKVAESINQIVLKNQQASLNAINDVALNSQQIALTTKQQAIAISQVVEAMNSLNQGAAETVNGINQTKIGLQKLNETAQNLNALV